VPSLAAHRRAAGISQPELAQALGRVRTQISKVEHGVRGMPAALWEIADDLCRADGALVAEYGALAEVESTYRERCRATGYRFS
jgi:transcriptional regulator with XRE-family HTH domain